MFNNLMLIVVVSLLANCQRDETGMPEQDPLFEIQPVSVEIAPGFIDEASGIADSRSSPGFLWIEQDSGNPPDLSLLSYDAKVRKRVHLKGVSNRDWEDIAVGNGPLHGVNYLYLADIGDNFNLFATYTIYRFPEPGMQTDTINAIDRISFSYPNGSQDAEAILVDNLTTNIYIVSKKGAKSQLYKLENPQTTTNTLVASLVGELPFNEVVSAALSPSGREIIIKTYKHLYYWARKENETIEAALQKPHTILGYKSEPQGEAVCFKRDNSGFFTVSEKPANVSSVSVHFYKRK